MYKNIKLEEISSQYVFKDLIKEAKKAGIKSHKLQWFIYRYLLYCLKYNLFEIALKAYKNIEFDGILKKETNILIPIKNIEILIFINLGEYKFAKNLILSNTKYIQRKKMYSTDIKTYYKSTTNIVNALQIGQKQQVIKEKKELHMLCETNYFADNLGFRTDFLKHWLFNNPIFSE